MIFQKLFPGCKSKRGVLGTIINGTKKAWQETEPFDWPLHLSGKIVQGLSPVDLETGKIKWLGLDVDLTIKPQEFCGNIWSLIGTQYWCYQTMGNKWRVVEHLDEWIGADEGKQRAKDLEKKVEKVCGYKCDGGHTLPQGYTLEEDQPGNWWFMPYHDERTICYGPSGNKLTEEQLEFRYRYNNHPVIISCIGMKGKGENNSRRKALFAVALYKRHFPDCDIRFTELNKHFATPLDDEQLEDDISHVEKSVLKYDKEYLLNGLPGWIEKFCGAKPILDAKGISEVNKVLTIKYIYVRDRTDFFELLTKVFVSKDQLNDWWKHITKKDNMASLLLKDESLNKIQSYFTHAGLPSGIVELERGRIKGLEPGKYLNIYQESGVEAKPGDISKFDEYYTWALGKENWLIVKQCLSFMLNEGGEKIMWFIIWHSEVQGVGKGLFALVMQSLFGTKNVKINVSFKYLTTGHSTVIEGAQIIVLNELNLTNSKGDLKELSNEFKSFITEPNLIINPKNKPLIEIPNLCNFFVFSNSDTPLYLGATDRRAFVVNINRTKDEVKQKLEDEGYKKEILKMIKDPSALKHHLLKDVKYDREMFFRDAPVTKDKEELIKANKSEFEKLMDKTFEDLSFPFGNQVSKEGVHYTYKGLMHTLTLYKNLKASSLFKGTFFKIDNVEDYLKAKCIPWPNNKTTKQIITLSGAIRVYLTHNWTLKEKHLREMTEGELGKLWDVEPGKEDLNKYIKELPNYETPGVEKEKKEHSSHCWVPGCVVPGTKEKTPINSDTDELCPECNYGYKCSECGECECARPNSKIRQAQEKFKEAWGNRKSS